MVTDLSKKIDLCPTQERPPTPPEAAAPPTPPLPPPDIFCDYKPEEVADELKSHDRKKPGFWSFRSPGTPLPSHMGGHAEGEASHDDILDQEPGRRTRVRRLEMRQIRHDRTPAVLQPHIISPADVTHEKLKRVVDDIVMGATPDAAQTVIDLMQCDDKRVALHAATALLDRAFGKPEQTKKSLSLSHSQTVVVIRDGSEGSD